MPLFLQGVDADGVLEDDGAPLGVVVELHRVVVDGAGVVGGVNQQLAIMTIQRVEVKSVVEMCDRRKSCAIFSLLHAYLMGQRIVTSASWMYNTSMGSPGPASRMKRPVSSSSPLIVLKDLTFTMRTFGIHNDLERTNFNFVNFIRDQFILAESRVDSVPSEGSALRPVPVQPGLRPPQHDVRVHGDAEVDVVNGGDVLHAKFYLDSRRPPWHLFRDLG